MNYDSLSNSDAAVFTALVESICAPEPVYPPVSQTAAVDYFDRYLRASPAINRLGFRLILHIVEYAPLAIGLGHRFSRLEPMRRIDFIQRWSESRLRPLRVTFILFKGIVFMAYYGDESVLKACGYDPDANIERARALRHKEGRP